MRTQSVRPIEANEALRVEGDSGEVFVVASSGTCSCGQHECQHSDYARQLRAREDDLYYAAKSGLHKELRRGDVGRALGFGRIVEWYRNGEVLRYLRRILFEETRNLELLRLLEEDQATDWPDLVAHFCRATKDWELPWDEGFWTPRWITVLDGLGNSQPFPDPSPRAIRDLVRRQLGETPNEVYALVVWCGLGFDQERGQIKRVVAEELSSVATARQPEWATELDLCRRSYNDELTVLFEVATGAWISGEAHARRQLSLVDTTSLPSLRDYVYDVHTRPGIRRLANHGPPLRFEEAMPPGLDLRWSGSESGTLWRVLAMQQHGTVDVPWETVSLPPPLRAMNERLVRHAWREWNNGQPDAV